MLTAVTICVRKNSASISAPMKETARATGWIQSDPMPDDFSFQLYPDDLERIEWHIEDAMARVPLCWVKPA